MKLLILLCSIVVLILLGSFVYFATTDVPLEQDQVSKTIGNDRFLKDGSN